MHLLVWLLFFALGVFFRSASAQSPWSGAISGGYATGLDNGDLTHGSVALALGFFGGSGGSVAFGGEVGYDQHENWTEVVVDGFPFEHDRSAWHLTAMLRFRSAEGSIRPYGLAGLGVYVLRHEGDDFLAPGINVGTGLEFHPSDGPIGITLGARLHLAGRPRDDVLDGAGFLALLLGVTYR